VKGLTALERVWLGSRFLGVGAPKGNKTPEEVVLRQPWDFADPKAADKVREVEVLEGERKATSGILVER
jgi:hypothetical protein